jgi:hypothetical protein
MRYSAERRDIKTPGIYSELGNAVEADSIEEAKLKVRKLFLMKGEILGDWFEDGRKLCAYISSNDRRLHSSGIIIFV